MSLRAVYLRYSNSEFMITNGRHLTMLHYPSLTPLPISQSRRQRNRREALHQSQSRKSLRASTLLTLNWISSHPSWSTSFRDQIEAGLPGCKSTIKSRSLRWWISTFSWHFILLYLSCGYVRLWRAWLALRFWSFHPHLQGCVQENVGWTCPRSVFALNAKEIYNQIYQIYWWMLC